MRKVLSTNSINENHLKDTCGMAYTASLLEGRWKLSILGFLLTHGKLRYSDLKNKLAGISEKMLAIQLKELEKDNLITRTVYPEVPPKVEYELSELGKSLKNILNLLSEWGEINRKQGS